MTSASPSVKNSMKGVLNQNFIETQGQTNPLYELPNSSNSSLGQSEIMFAEKVPYVIPSYTVDDRFVVLKH